MKQMLLSLGVVVFLVVLVDSSYCAQSRIIDKRNEYGGQTVEETYSPGEDQDKAGLMRLVQYFDANERILRLASHFNDDHALIDGVQRSVQYFDNKFYRTGIRTRVEFYYTDDYAAREGLTKAIQYCDEDEKRTKIEYFYTDAYAKKRQIFRLEVLYDLQGNILKRTYSDKDGILLAVDEKKK